MASKRMQTWLAKAFNSTGAPTRTVPVGIPGDPAAFTNYLQAVDVRGMDALTLFVSGAGGTTSTVAIEATNDPNGVNGWAPVAIRDNGIGTYNITALTVTPGTYHNRFIDPTIDPAWIRVNVSVNTGPVVLEAFVEGNV